MYILAQHVLPNFIINHSFYLFQHLYPKSQIDVYVTILEDDGCTLAAALTVSGLALADAAIQMFDTLVGASVVMIKKSISFFTCQNQTRPSSPQHGKSA